MVPIQAPEAVVSTTSTLLQPVMPMISAIQTAPRTSANMIPDNSIARNSATAGDIESIMAKQLQLMSMQVAMLSGYYNYCRAYTSVIEAPEKFAPLSQRQCRTFLGKYIG